MFTVIRDDDTLAQQQQQQEQQARRGKFVQVTAVHINLSEKILQIKKWSPVVVVFLLSLLTSQEGGGADWSTHTQPAENIYSAVIQTDDVSETSSCRAEFPALRLLPSPQHSFTWRVFLTIFYSLGLTRDSLRSHELLPAVSSASPSRVLLLLLLPPSPPLWCWT